MLSIRAEQMKPFRDAADAAFLRRVADYVRYEHAEHAVHLPGGSYTVEQLPDDLLLALVGRGVERARAYGMTWESSLTAFVVLTFVVAPNFDEHPLVRRVLGDEQTEPDLRIDGLNESVTDENWEAARQSYDAGAWGVEGRGR